jgi:hypothetical protein
MPFRSHSVRLAVPGAFAGFLAALLLSLSGMSAFALVPQAERVAGAMAESNAAAGRAQALRIELNMRIGDGPPVARGELVTHPTGMARLELRGAGDLVEKHILQGSRHLAGRNGERLDEPRAFLPPLFLLQIDSAVSLTAALEEFRIRADLVGLAPCEEHDCYVVGDPARVAPPQVDEEGNRGQDPGGMGVSSAVGGGETALLDDRVLAFPSQRPATLWIDMEGFDVRRMRLDDGVRVLFGPYVMFERVRVPSWLQVEEERGSVRFEVVDVTPVNAPASAFGEDWLLAPSTTPPSPDQFPAGSPDAPERSRR